MSKRKTRRKNTRKRRNMRGGEHPIITEYIYNQLTINPIVPNQVNINPINTINNEQYSINYDIEDTLVDSETIHFPSIYITKKNTNSISDFYKIIPNNLDMLDYDYNEVLITKVNVLPYYLYDSLEKIYNGNNRVAPISKKIFNELKQNNTLTKNNITFKWYYGNTPLGRYKESDTLIKMQYLTIKKNEEIRCYSISPSNINNTINENAELDYLYFKQIDKLPEEVHKSSEPTLEYEKPIKPIGFFSRTRDNLYTRGRNFIDKFYKGQNTVKSSSVTPVKSVTQVTPYITSDSTRGPPARPITSNDKGGRRSRKKSKKRNKHLAMKSKYKK